MKRLMIVMLFASVAAACGAGATRIPANLYKEKQDGKMRIKIPDGWQHQFRASSRSVLITPGKDAKVMFTVKVETNTIPLPPDEAGLDALAEKALRAVLEGPPNSAKIDSIKKEPIAGGKIICAVATKGDPPLYYVNCIRLDDEARKTNEFHAIEQVGDEASYKGIGQHFLAVDLLKDAHLVQ